SGERIAAVPERVGDDLHVRPRGQCEARGAVPKVVEPDRWQTSLVRQVDEALPQGVSADPFAPQIGEDQPTVCPQHTTLLTLALLGMAPVAQGHDVGLSQVDGAVAALCLRTLDGEGTRCGEVDVGPPQP